MKKPITIGKAAQQAQVNVETILYYQRIGLINKPKKPLQGYRSYPEQTATQIKFIKRAQTTGFTLKEIKRLLSLGRDQCDETRTLANEKLLDVKQKINDLKAIEKSLNVLIQHCEIHQTDEACPIIDAFSTEK